MERIPAALAESVEPDGLFGVLRAGRGEPTGRRQKGRQSKPVEPDQPDTQPTHRHDSSFWFSISPSCRSASRQARSRSEWGRERACLRGNTRMFLDSTRLQRTSRANSRKTRLARLRTTAVPSRFPTMIPIRVWGQDEAQETRLKYGVCWRRPDRLVCSISAVTRRKSVRSAVGRRMPPRLVPRRHTVKRARPLARRRAKTLRPSFVFMRRRNPWVFLRFSLEGC